MWVHPLRHPRRQASRTVRRTRAVVTVIALLLALLAPAAGASASNPTPWRQEPVLTQAQLVSWYRAHVPATRPLRAGSPSVTIEQLVRFYYEEGAREGIAGDLVFLQALHETAWFNFPAGGCVRPTDHNYAGIGAYDCHLLNDAGLPRHVWRWPTVRDGVRAHVQYLRAYADPTVSRPSDLASPVPTALEGRNFANQWNWIVTSYRVNNGGPWPFLDQYGAGIWAADPQYVSKIDAYVRSALTFNGYSADAARHRAWHLRHVNAGGHADSRARLGGIDDHVLACDWNGNGRDTPAMFRNGRWIVSNQRDGGGTRVTIDFGTRGDIPVCGDWNGDGRDTIGVVRDGKWLLRNSLSGGTPNVTFDYGRTQLGDIPIVGDWNGNGRDGVGIIRDGDWHLRNGLSSGPGQIVFTYGRLTRGDRPLVGDWNGNGRDGVGIVREGQWHLRNSLSGGPGQITFTYGRVLQGDYPLAGDWTGDGRDTPGIVR
jgi:hypothetical protein